MQAQQLIILSILALDQRLVAQTCTLAQKSVLSPEFSSSPAEAYGASPTSPSVFRVTAESFEVYIWRPSGASFSAPTRLEIRRSSTPDKVVCATDWVDTSPYYLALQFDDEEEWLVYVFDKAAGGPTGDAPYVPAVSFGSVMAPVIVEETPKPWEMDRGPFGSCRETEKPLHAGATLESVVNDGKLSVQVGPLIARYRFEAGRRVYVIPKWKRSDVSSPRVFLRAYAKENRESTFLLGCAQELSPDQGPGEMIVIGFPGQSAFRPIWMIELICSANCRPGVLPLAIEIRREAGSERSDRGRTDGSDYFRLTSRSFEYFCYSSDNSGRAARPADVTGFAGTTDLRIKLVTGNLRQYTSRILTGYLLAAMSMWRRACVDCVPDHLTVVRLGNSLYLDRDLAGWLFDLDSNEVSASDKDSMSEPGNVFFGFASVIGGRRVGLTASPSSYVEVPASETRWRSLCRVPVSYLPEPVRRIQKALPCETATKDHPALGVEIRLAQNGLSCGKDLNIIACEQLGANVELNVKDYTFTAIDSTTAVIGSGSTRVDLMQVLLHEIGHWIGLGHTLSTSGIDIMEEYYDAGKCIEDTSVNLLERVVVDRARSKNKTSSALRFGH